MRRERGSRRDSEEGGFSPLMLELPYPNRNHNREGLLNLRHPASVTQIIPDKGSGFLPSSSDKLHHDSERSFQNGT